MLFTSMEFLFFFLPIVYGVNYLLKPQHRNYWLLLASLFFYAWGEPAFVIIMLVSICMNYGIAVLIEKTRKSSIFPKIALIAAMILNLGLLFVFKYLNFAIDIFLRCFPAMEGIVSRTTISLPIGISFFTFQAMSYVLDVYRGAPAQKNPFYLGLYISLFPQLVAGPIVRYSTIAEQIENRKVSFSAFSEGALRFIRGFNKKMLLANVLAEVVDDVFALNGISVGTAWLGALCYSLQIFFDFSGYSDMAIGLGAMLGFKFEENFNYPYISANISEFWRRWHISLGNWFRDYVYFPLGGSRVENRLVLIRNLLLVWLLTGIWHGAEWTFLFWGLLHGAFIILEKTLQIPQRIKQSKRKIYHYLYHVLTLVIVLVGWVLFRANNLDEGRIYIQSMFGLHGNSLTDSNFYFYAREYIVYLFAGIICCTPVFAVVKKKMRQNDNVLLSAGAEFVGDAVQLILFIFSVSFLIMKSHNPFIYFNF